MWQYGHERVDGVENTRVELFWCFNTSTVSLSNFLYHCTPYTPRQNLTEVGERNNFSVTNSETVNQRFVSTNPSWQNVHIFSKSTVLGWTSQFAVQLTVLGSLAGTWLDVCMLYWTEMVRLAFQCRFIILPLFQLLHFQSTRIATPMCPRCVYKASCYAYEVPNYSCSVW